MSESIREVLAREAAEAEARAEAEERGEIPAMPGQRGRRRASDPSQVYAVRIPVSRLRELRRVADELGTPPSALIRQWVLERLDDMAAGEPGEAPDSDAGSMVIQVKLGRRRQRSNPPASAGGSGEDRVRRYA